MGKNSYSSSNELDAQNVQPHQKKVTTPAGKGHACCVMLKCEKLELRSKRKFLAVRQHFTVAKVRVLKTLKGRPEQQDFTKKQNNGKANCCLHFT